MKFIKKIGPIFIIAIAIYLFDTTRMFSLGNYQPKTGTDELIRFSIYLLYSAVLGYANFWVVAYLSKKIPWEVNPKKRAIYGIIGAVLASLAAIFFIRIITEIIINGKSWSVFIANESVFIYIYTLFITLIIVLIFYVINFYKALTKNVIQEQQSIVKTETAKYETLKSQIDPHFLFNSLNVLSALIAENPEKAEDFTAKLSKIYRYVLEQKEKNLVLLSDELAFAKQYLELLQMRFENALVFSFPKDKALDKYKIAPLSLQILLENAVKHNVASKNSPLEINIKIKQGSLLISNNLNPKKLLQKSSKKGLQNIIDRYALLTIKKVHIDKTNKHFIVRLPLLTNQTKTMKTTHNLDKRDQYEKAKDRVKEMKSFFGSLYTYLGVNAFLIFINYRTGWDHKWFFYPLIGWGIGLFFHYLEVFDKNPFLSKDWEKRKIKELMQEEDRELWE